MLTQEQVLAGLKEDAHSACIDGRDRVRLAAFFPLEKWTELGVVRRTDGEGAPSPPAPWTEEAILDQLKHDVAFGFEKALNQRGLSSNMMAQVVLMWLWILEDPFAAQKSEEIYPMYGLPIFKHAAVKYGFPNPIGEDSGREDKYEG